MDVTTLNTSLIPLVDPFTDPLAVNLLDNQLYIVSHKCLSTPKLAWRYLWILLKALTNIEDPQKNEIRQVQNCYKPAVRNSDWLWLVFTSLKTFLNFVIGRCCLGQVWIGQISHLKDFKTNAWSCKYIDRVPYFSHITKTPFFFLFFLLFITFSYST